MVGEHETRAARVEQRIQELSFSRFQNRRRRSAPAWETLQTGNLLFLGGILPLMNHDVKYVYRLGRSLTSRLYKR
jgi:hypothetical protein